MRVVLVDSYPIFREGLKTLIASSCDLSVVGEADTCHDIFETAKNADLVIIDGEVDSFALLNALEKARNKGRRPYVLVLTKHIEEQHAVQMLAAGADGYLHKSHSPETVMEAIRKIVRGGKYVPTELAETLIFAMNGVAGQAPLSHREYQVLSLLAGGKGMTEIAQHLSLSVKTVSTYRSRLLQKLSLKSNAQLIHYAFKTGMVA
ncbi:MAG TPA: response regulator transcription factor [Terriglobia bacterium]|nr:response regulator transcription factor [Terriglobia bacterium]